MQRVISDQDVQRIVKLRRQWRFTDLSQTLIQEFGCADSTARRTIIRSVDHGLLERSGRYYHAPPQPRAPRSQRTPAHRLIPDRLRMLEIISERDHWMSAELLRHLSSRLDIDLSVARRNFGYARSYGYVEPIYGAWRLSDQCRALLPQYGKLEGTEGFRFATFLSGRPMKGFDRWPGHKPSTPGAPPTCSP
jgi:hypothetical protein